MSGEREPFEPRSATGPFWKLGWTGVPSGSHRPRLGRWAVLAMYASRGCAGVPSEPRTAGRPVGRFLATFCERGCADGPSGAPDRGLAVWLLCAKFVEPRLSRWAVSSRRAVCGRGPVWAVFEHFWDFYPGAGGAHTVYRPAPNYTQL